MHDANDEKNSDMSVKATNVYVRVCADNAKRKNKYIYNNNDISVDVIQASDKIHL